MSRTGRVQFRKGERRPYEAVMTTIKQNSKRFYTKLAADYQLHCWKQKRDEKIRSRDPRSGWGYCGEAQLQKILTKTYRKYPVYIQKGKEHEWR